MGGKRVLLVDDDVEHCAMLQEYLSREGYEPQVCYTGEDALDMARRERFDLILLDIILPGKDGIEVCRELLRFSSVPIIFLTARDDEIDRVLGLEMGADDYMAKPFSPRELVARMKAVLRRVSEEGQPAPPAVVLPGLAVDATSRETYVGDKLVRLTPKEFDLLWLLVCNPTRAFTRADLLTKVWGHTEFSGCERTVDTHVKQLRKKVFSDPAVPHRLTTVWGVGYKFEPAA